MNKTYESKSIYRAEYELILNVKALRNERGWSQITLSEKMGFVSTFVGKCESLDQVQKYNLRHIGILKSVFELDSLDNLFPNGIPKDELIIIRYKKVPKTKADGTPSKLFDTIVVDIITVDEDTKSQSNKTIRKKTSKN